MANTAVKMSSGALPEEPIIKISSDGAVASAIWTRFDNSKMSVIESAAAIVNGNTASWGGIVSLSQATQEAYQPQFGLAKNGTKATAVWIELNGNGVSSVRSASATINGNTASWGEVSVISTQDRDALAPQISISNDGSRATVVWQRLDKDGWITQTASATIDGNRAVWGPVTTLTMAGTSTQGAQIKLSGDGTKAISVWYRIDSGKWVIQSASATIDGITANWGPVSRVSTRYDIAYTPQIGLSDDGSRATVVWSQGLENGVTSIYSASATIDNNSVNWGPNVNISSSVGGKYNPKIGLSSNGSRATAVWSHDDGTDEVIQSSSASISGNIATWGPVSILSIDSNSSEIGLSEDGNKATVVWNHHEGGQYIIQTASAVISETLATWSTTTDLLTGDDYSDRHPQVVVSGDGTQAASIWGDEYLVQSSFAMIRPPSKSYTLKIIKPSTGLITSEPLGIVCGGKNKLCSEQFFATTLSAKPNDGYAFKSWINCKNSDGNVCSVTLDGPLVIGAKFTKLPKHVLKVKKSKMGSVTSNPDGINCKESKTVCSGKFVSGSLVTVTAHPISGYVFSGWSGACTSNSQCKIYIDRPRNVSAIFLKQ